VFRGASRGDSVTLSEDHAGRAAFGHNGMPYAATRNGTLDLAEDDHGLHWAARLDADDPESQVLARKVKSGLISECSFAFRVSDDDWSADFKTRRIRSVTLNRGDVSLVHASANPATSVAMRARQAVRVPDHDNRAPRV
jgi:HK97 family phage prohead protease